MVQLEFTQDELSAVLEYVDDSWRERLGMVTSLTPREEMELYNQIRSGRLNGQDACFEWGSPLRKAYIRLSFWEGWGHRSMHDMLYTMVQLGGVWKPMDNPYNKSCGFARPDGSLRQFAWLTVVKEAWGRTKEKPSRQWARETPLREWIRSPEGREKIAHVITVGDHCLEFPYADEYPWVFCKLLREVKG